MLFSKKKSNKTMLQYQTIEGTATGENEITSTEGICYKLFTNPIHLQHESKLLDVGSHLGKTIRIAGSVGNNTIYEAKIV